MPFVYLRSIGLKSLRLSLPATTENLSTSLHPSINLSFYINIELKTPHPFVSVL